MRAPAILVAFLIVVAPAASQRQPDMAAGVRLPAARTADLAHVDPAAFATALGSNPGRIFAFVRDAIEFEAYTGVLRGPRGTLLALAGNAADRAALLAAMLRAAGQQVRFARGTLDAGAARTLVDEMWTPAVVMAGPPAGVDHAPFRDALAGMSAAISRDFTLIRDLVRGASITPRAGPSIDDLVAETRPHVWVQWHDQGKWIDLDPSFRNATPGATFTRADDVADALPDDLAHRVTLRIRLEETRGGVSNTRVILEHQTTAATLASPDVVVGHMPEAWAGPGRGLAGSVQGALEETGRVKPVLILGEHVVFGAPFQQEEKTAGLGGLRNMLGGRSASLATAEWLEVTFTAPGGAPVQVSRDVFDHLGPARRVAGLPLTDAEIASRIGGGKTDVRGTVLSLLFATGRVHLQHLLGLAPERLAGDPQRPDLVANARQLTIAFAALADALCSTIRGPDGTVIRFYPDAPRLFVGEVSSAGGKPRLVLDLRHDRQRAVGTGPRGRDVFFAQVFRGVVNGQLERTLVESTVRIAQSRADGASTMSTSRVFDQVAADAVPVVLLPRDGPQLDARSAPDGRARLDATIASGHLAVVPKQSVVVDGRPRLAWWRVNPRSGETVAVTDEGLHQSSFEITVEREKGTTNVKVTVTHYLGPNDVTNIGAVPRTVVYNAGVRQGFFELWRDIDILFRAGGKITVENAFRIPTSILW